MKKFFRLGKRMMALFIVVLLNINSYAAIGANDGSAFVTKAEFDALVNTFNEQMDTYQSGLNAKIDGAIANYLAGLSSVTQISVDPLFPDPKGIWSASVTTDTKPWKEGSIAMTLSGHVARLDRPTYSQEGALKLTCNPISSQDFYEHLINQYSVGGVWYGEYNGYNKSAISCEAYGGDTSTNGAWKGPDFRANGIRLGGVFWYTGGRVNGRMTINIANVSGENGHYLYLDGGACIREVNEKPTDNVICTGTSISFPYFNLVKTSGSNALWCYDSQYSTNTLHTKSPSFNYLFAAASASGYNFNDSKSKISWSQTINTVTWDTASGVACKPFLGFTPNVQNWNRIYSTYADDIVDDLVSNANAETVTINSKKHLLITNGWPIIKAEAGSVVSMPVKFAKIGNEYKNIDIWLKASAFKANENVKTTTDADIIKATNVQNMIPSAYSNAITCDCINGNGQGVLKFTMPKTGYVFMKWSVAGNEAAGGGTFYPQTMMVTVNQ